MYYTCIAGVIHSHTSLLAKSRWQYRIGEQQKTRWVTLAQFDIGSGEIRVTVAL